MDVCLRSFTSFRLFPLSQKWYILRLQLLWRRIFLTQPLLTITTRTIRRSWLNSRLHDGLIFDIVSWVFLFQDNWRKTGIFRKHFCLPQWIVVPLQAVTSSIGTLSCLELLLRQTQPIPHSPLSMKPPNQFLFPFSGLSYRVSHNV